MLRELELTKTSPEVSNQQPVCLMVLGPHRCGTSALTGVLTHLGGDIPTTNMGATERNESGYFESKRVMAFNDRLLDALGSGWNDISSLNISGVPAQVYDSFMGEAVEILQEEFSTARLPLLKDPRICRLVAFWTEAFIRTGYKPIYIHTHRNPLEAALSLESRDGISVEIGLLIWLRHVLDAEAATRGETRVFTNYKALLDDWLLQVSQIETAIGLTFYRNTVKVRQQVNDFLTQALRHQQMSAEDVHRSVQVTDMVRETFAIFERWTGTAGNSADYSALDMLRRRLNEMQEQTVTFARALKSGSARARALEQAATQLQDENDQLAAEMERVQQLSADGEAMQNAKIADLEGGLKQRSLEAEQWFEETRRLTQTLETLQSTKTQLQESLRDRETQLRSLEKSVDERFGELAKLGELLLESQAKTEQERGEKARLAAEIERVQQRSADKDTAQNAKIADLEGGLRQRSLEAEQWFEKNRHLTQTVATLESEKTQLQAKLQDRETQLRSLEKNIEERLGEIAQLSKQLLESKAASEQDRREKTRLLEQMEQASDKNHQLTQALATLELEKTQLQASLQDWETQLRSLEQNNEERFGEIAQLSKQLLESQAIAEKDRGEKTRLVAQMEPEFEKVRQLTQTLATLQSEKIQLQASLQDQETQLRSLEQNNEERFGEIAQLSKQLLESQAIAEKDRIARDQQLEMARSQAETLKQEIAEVLAREEQASKHVEALLSSTSWKMTGPLRRLVSLLRR